MSKITEEYCDLCGAYFYHSIHSWTVSGRQRWWWQGSISRSLDIDVCGDCRWVLEYLMQERRELVQARILKLKGKSPRKQMDNKPKPISKSVIVRLFG